VDTEGRDEEQAGACPCLHERPVKVHHPELGLNLRWWKLGVDPFYDEIC
jgi:hypothetical protein